MIDHLQSQSRFTRRWRRSKTSAKGKQLDKIPVTYLAGYCWRTNDGVPAADLSPHPRGFVNLVFVIQLIGHIQEANFTGHWKRVPQHYIKNLCYLTLDCEKFDQLNKTQPIDRSSLYKIKQSKDVICTAICYLKKNMWINKLTCEL